MRILIISTFFPPTNSIASLRPYTWAKYWSQEGHEVTVLTLEQTQSTINNANLQSDSLNLNCDSFKILHVPMPKIFQFLKRSYRNPTNCVPSKNKHPSQNSNHSSNLSLNIKSILSQLKYSFERIRTTRGIFKTCRMPELTEFWIGPAIKAAAQISPFNNYWDLIVSTAGPYTVHKVAYALKKQGYGKKWIADYRDLWSDNHLQPGIFPFNWIEGTLEEKLMKKADKITTVSGPLAKFLAKRHGKEKVHVIENGIDEEDYLKLPNHSIFHESRYQKGESINKFRIVYTGTVYDELHQPEPILQAIHELNKEQENDILNHLEVIFIGNGGVNLPTKINRWNVSDWVKLIPSVKREDALRMQRDANLLLFLPCHLFFEGIVSGKIMEYLASGTPIIAIGGVEPMQMLHLNVDSDFGTVEKMKLEIGPSFGIDVELIKRFLIDQLRKFKNKGELKDSTISLNSMEDTKTQFMERFSRKNLAQKMIKTCY